MRKNHSIEHLKGLFDAFYTKNNRYPTQHDMKKEFGMSARTIQRYYGSLETVRKQLNLPILNYTKGEHRSNKALLSTNKSYTEQNRIFKQLLSLFGIHFIHEQSPYSDGSRQRCDFKIFHKEGELYVDIFYASSYPNMVGCINAKLRKFDESVVWGDIILINTNHDLDGDITKMISARKKSLPKNIRVMSEKNFFEYCSTLHRL